MNILGCLLASLDLIPSMIKVASMTVITKRKVVKFLDAFGEGSTRNATILQAS